MKNKNWISLFSAIKFMIYASIASYYYSIGSKWTLAWSFLAVFALALFIVSEIKHNENKNL